MALAIFSNKRVLFTANRYFTYLIRFIQGMFIAGYLGPYYFGLWGFYTLVIQYFSYSNFGVQYSTNVELSIIDKSDANNNDRIGSIIFNSLFFSLTITTVYIIIGLLLKSYWPNLLHEYNFGDVVMLLFLIGGINNINIVYINIYRSFQNFTIIAISEMIFAGLPFITLFFFRDIELIYAILYAMLSAKLINLFLFVARFKYPISYSFKISMVSSLVITGIGLLLYNLSYNLFFLINKSFVSVYYSVKQLGLFTFAFTIAAATMLGVKAFMFTIYPKLLYMFRDNPNSIKKTLILIKDNNDTYNTAVRIIIFLMIFLSYPFIMIFNKYVDILLLLNLILYAQIIFTASTMYGIYVFANKRYWGLLKYSVLLVFVFTVLSYLAALYKINLNYFGFLVVIFAAFFSLIQKKYAMYIMGYKMSSIKILKSFFDYKIVLPIIIFVIAHFTITPVLYSLSSLLFFVLSAKSIKKTATKMFDFIK